MLKLLIVLSPFLTMASKRFCPLNINVCKSICKKFEAEVPRPTLFDMCIIGCEAAVNEGDGELDCKAPCRKTPLPRPTTTNACKSGCTGAISELHYCNMYAAKQAAAASHADL